MLADTHTREGEGRHRERISSIGCTPDARIMDEFAPRITLVRGSKSSQQLSCKSRTPQPRECREEVRVAAHISLITDRSIRGLARDLGTGIGRGLVVKFTISGRNSLWNVCIFGIVSEIGNFG